MKLETKVGALFLLAVGMVLGFAYFMGALNPFTNRYDLFVLYNYAGGIEEGSPVRVMGIEVGKVKSIEFSPEQRDSQGNEAKLRMHIQIDKKAWSSVRKDSEFFINMAGVIGEKFLEISPGSLSQPEFASGDTVRGQDPPRVDQLISQSYGLAGKVIEILNKNEGSMTSLITQLDNVLIRFNQTLLLLDKASKNKEAEKMIDNVVQLTDDLAYLTKSLRSEKAEDTYKLLHKLIWRLETVDGPALKKFFQEEGIKAKMW